MKSIFDPKIRTEIISRIDKLQFDSKAQWGKMNVTQMLQHCCMCEEYYLGKVRVNRSFIGRIFGKPALKKILGSDTTLLSKNAPTASQFIPPVKTEAAGSPLLFVQEKQKWKSLIESYAAFHPIEFRHWFFGKMTTTQLGEFIYKHCDHHLRQFKI